MKRKMAFDEFLAQCKSLKHYICRAIISPVRIVQIESIFRNKKRISLMLLDFNLKKKRMKEEEEEDQQQKSL